MESKVIITPEMDENFKNILELTEEKVITAKDAEEHDKKLFNICKELIDVYGCEYKDMDDFGVCCLVKTASYRTTLSVRSELDINGKKVSSYFAPSENELKQLLKD